MEVQDTGFLQLEHSEPNAAVAKLVDDFLNDCTTFRGYLATTDDALLLIEATVQGLCRRVTRRLHAKEQDAVRSGSIFVFDEVEANMKRWTDKMIWSPSRQVGNFFVYRQMITKVPRGTSIKQIEAMSLAALGGSAPAVDPDLAAAEKQYVASLTTSPQYARDGLVKKTLAVGTYHVISYFTLDDVQSHRLVTPSSSGLFDGIPIPSRLTGMLATAASSGRSSEGGDDLDEGSSYASGINSRSESRRPSVQHGLLAPPGLDLSDAHPLPRTRAASLPTDQAHQYSYAPQYYTSSFQSREPVPPVPPVPSSSTIPQVGYREHVMHPARMSGSISYQQEPFHSPVGLLRLQPPPPLLDRFGHAYSYPSTNGPASAPVVMPSGGMRPYLQPQPLRAYSEVTPAGLVTSRLSQYPVPTPFTFDSRGSDSFQSDPATIISTSAPHSQFENNLPASHLPPRPSSALQVHGFQPQIPASWYEHSISYEPTGSQSPGISPLHQHHDQHYDQHHQHHHHHQHHQHQHNQQHHERQHGISNQHQPLAQNLQYMQRQGDYQ